MEFPDLLFESPLNDVKQARACLVCGKCKAETFLRNQERVIVPMCRTCGSDWNFHGYYILRRLKPKQLLWNLFKYKLTHFRPSLYRLYRDVKGYAAWGKKMKRFAKMM